jgi:glycosyltransferase involved in cell wall biosynthesis
LYKNKTIGVVVPAYNEEIYIGEVIQTMPDFVDRIYIINDCSSDSTLKACEKSTDNRLTIISHDKRQGPGGAMLTGYKKAREENMDITAIMAGDGQMDPDILDQIIEPVCQGKADYTKGDRLSIPLYHRGMPKLRLFGNRLLTIIIGIASGYRHVADPLNGYTAVTHETLARLDLNKIEPGYAFETDLLVKLGFIGARVINVNMPARYRGEKSKLAYFGFILYTSWVIFRDYVSRIRKLRKKKTGIQSCSSEVRESESC